MKIVLVSAGFPPVQDGIGDYTHKVYGEMKRQLGPDNVHVITGTCESRISDDAHVLSVVERWNLRGIRIVLNAIREIRPDVVHIQYPFYPQGERGRSLYMSLLPFLLRILIARVRVCCTIHEFDNKTLKGKLCLLASMACSHQTLIVKEAYRKDILRVCRLLSRRITYVPIGSNISDHETPPSRKLEIRESIGWAKTDPILAYFGLLREGKGIDSLIDMFLTARKTIGNLRLLLIGGFMSGFDEDALLQQLRTADALKSVLMTGWVNEEKASEYLATADVCVLPYEDGVSTKRGGFMAAVEHCRPIVTTRPTDRIDELQNGQNVVLVPPGNVLELAKTIRAIVNDQDLRETLRKNVADLKHHYSWEVIVKKHIELYQASSNGSRDRNHQTYEDKVRR